MKLICQDCGREEGHLHQGYECDCGGLFDLAFTPVFDLDAIASRPADMWRYAEALPADASTRVSLGEGMTPLLTVRLAGQEVLVKAEQGCPTGSYKDRGASMLITKAREMGVAEVVEDSSGNAGASMAAYCAAASMGCRIYVPEATSPGKLAQVDLYGADLRRVPGSREDAAVAVLEAAQDAFYASHSYSPYFFHGTKTWAFEVAEQLGWRAPDTVVLPAGNGTLLLGAHIGFCELKDAGIIDQVPKFVAVQNSGCAPLKLAFDQGLDHTRYMRPESSLAEGITIAEPVRGAQMLAAVRETGGTVLAVDDSAIVEALRDMGRQGHCIEPTSAATIAGLARYLEDTPEDEAVVSVFTGHGLKAAGKIDQLLQD